MLVLSRKIEQSIAVGGAAGFENLLKITVLDVRKGRVRLGFEVDASVPVHRWEVWSQIHPDIAAEDIDETSVVL